MIILISCVYESDVHDNVFARGYNLTDFIGQDYFTPHLIERKSRTKLPLLCSVSTSFFRLSHSFSLSLFLSSFLLATQSYLPFFLPSSLFLLQVNFTISLFPSLSLTQPLLYIYFYINSFLNTHLFSHTYLLNFTSFSPPLSLKLNFISDCPFLYFTLKLYHPFSHSPSLQLLQILYFFLL